jgi:hypothetical protein
MDKPIKSKFPINVCELFKQAIPDELIENVLFGGLTKKKEGHKS